ncbi:DUF975 family protein [Candidatus Saccharibacteria bacterium]|nr:DUF975 family protein [Candidatus Saccharibacteria bacterium]
MDRASMKAHAKKQIEGKILTLLAIAIIIGFITGAVGFFGVIGSVASILITGAFTFAEAFIYLGITKKSRMPKIEDVFIGFKGDNFLRTLVAYLRYSIFTFLWSLLFIIPGIIKSISYSQMFYLLAEDDKLEAGEAQKESMELMEGHKWEYFVLGLSFIPWYLLCLVTLGIAAIYVVPYVQTTLAEYHVRLVNGGKSSAKETKEPKEAKVVKSTKTSKSAKTTKTTKKSSKTTK